MPTATDAPLPLNAYRYVKDAVPVPLPPPRIGGLIRLLKELNVGESATVPRATADDIYKTGRILNRSFTARRIDAERSRIWRTA
jgi:hypothetical protein